MPYPRARSAKVGEVGWGVVKLMDYTLLKSGHQIMVTIIYYINNYVVTLATHISLGLNCYAYLIQYHIHVSRMLCFPMFIYKCQVIFAGNIHT